MRLAALLPFALATAAALPARGEDPRAASSDAPDAAAAARPLVSCTGDYAEDLAFLLPRARDLERERPSYTFCIRATAVFECPYYGGDGALRRTRRKAVAHGTGFAYRQDEGGTLLLTNDHVAEWPAATDAQHRVEDVPAGCRRVSDSLRIVDNEADAYERDDVPLSRVVTDPQLDIAVLRASATLPMLPWKIGRSAGLQERDAVIVRGFPLGAFQADNVGKVISPFDHDDYGDWDHDDFVVDALLSPGSSGSPVLAVSCRTGQLELVGVYHAAYSRGNALNVVVGIDQVRDLMTTLKRTPRPRAAPARPLDAEARAALAEAAGGALEPFFPFGGLPAAVRVRADGALVFEVLPREFPLQPAPLLVVEDLPPAAGDGFGAPGRIWAGRGGGLKPYARAALDGEARAQLERMLDALRRDARHAFDLRAAAAAADGSRPSFDRVSRLERDLRRAADAHQQLAQAALDLADRLAPEPGEATVALADALAAPRPAAPAPTRTSAPTRKPKPTRRPTPAGTPGAAGAPPPLAQSAASGSDPGGGAATSSLRR